MPKIEPRLTGAILEAPDERDFDYSLIAGDPNVELPKSFRVSPIPIYNQGRLDCCVGAGIAAAKSLQEEEVLSMRHAWSLAKKYGALRGYPREAYGAYVTDGLKAVVAEGLLLDGTIDEDITVPRLDYMDVTLNKTQERQALKHRALTFWRVTYAAQDVEAIKRAMFETGNAVMTSVLWFSEYNKPKDGFLPNPKTSSSGHFFICTGWDVDKNGRTYLIFQNSWGESWGDRGYFYVYQDKVANHNFRSWYIFVDIPKDQALIINKYQGQLIKNTWDNKVYIVSNKHISWIENPYVFNWGANVLWGDWHEIVEVSDIEIVGTDKVNLK